MIVLRIKEARVDVNLRDVYIGKHNKFRTYALFKSEIKMEDYLRYMSKTLDIGRY